jgi:hypothetical protein
MPLHEAMMWFLGSALLILGTIPIMVLDLKLEARARRSKLAQIAGLKEIEAVTAEIVLPALVEMGNRFARKALRITKLGDKRRRTALPALTEILSTPEPLVIPHEPEPDYSSM